jgi:hypothetical protein
VVFSKKVKRVSGNIASIGIDLSISQLLNNYHIPFGVTIQHIMAYSPYDMALSIIALKLGISSKLVLSLIIAFLL